MKNRVTVTIAGQEYTLVAAEDVRYVQRVASHVDAKVQEVLDGAKVSMVDGAVLHGRGHRLHGTGRRKQL